VDDRVHPNQRGAQPAALLDIADDALDPCREGVISTAAERTRPVPPGDQVAHDLAAKRAGGASDQHRCH
jgi:hypothetical protein